MGVTLEGSTALLTGASSGIGRALALQLAPRVAGIALVARRAERLEALKKELEAVNPKLKVCVAPCDVSEVPDLERMVAQVERELGPVDLLINNAGLGYIGLFERGGWDKNHQMLRVNVEALTWLTYKLLPGMLQRRKGGILNISSGFGMSWMPGVATYCATKHYVTAFSESLRSELRGTGVSVTQICPGPVKTEFEEVAGNPVGMPPPAFLTLDADQCARESLRAFERGRAMHVPGFVMRVLMLMNGQTPRWLYRLAYMGFGAALRRKPA